MKRIVALSAAALFGIAGLAVVVPEAGAATVGNTVCVSTTGQWDIPIYVQATNGDATIPWGRCSTNSPYNLRNVQAFAIRAGTHCINEATGSNWNGGWFLDNTYVFKGSNTVTRFRCYHS